MHGALCIIELLELIFSHVCEKRFLNALARTCRAFLRPALALLWERIVTFEPFILLLPESKRYRDSETRITTIDDLTPSDVSRARFYAHFVRDLDLRNSSSSFEVDGPSVARVARALCASRRESGSCSPLTGDKSANPRQHQPFIFPNLRAFTLVAGYADSLPALLAPSVTDLELILHHRSMDVEELYRTMGILLSGVCPSRGDGRALGERDGVLAGRGGPDGLTVRSRRGCFPPSVKKLHVVLDYPDNQNHLFRELLARRGDGTRSLCGDSTSSPLTDSISSHPKDDIPTLPGDTISPHLSTSISSRLSDTIQSLVIDFSHLDTPTLQAIATMPSLEHLEVYGGYRAHSFELDDVLDISPATRTIADTSPATKNIAPHQKKTAPRLKSLAVDILSEGVLAPYIGGTVLRILQPPALTHLAMERPLTHLTMERILSAGHVRQACADIACSSAARTLAHLTLTGDWSGTTLAGDWSVTTLTTTLTHLTLTGDWTGTSVSPRDLRALHACHNLVVLELVRIAVRFGAGVVVGFGAGEVRFGARVVVGFDEEDIWEMGADRFGARVADGVGVRVGVEDSAGVGVEDSVGVEGGVGVGVEDSVGVGVGVEEEEIREMGAAWPRLRRFAVREVDVGGDTNEPQAGDTDEPQAGDTDEHHAGDTNEPQAGDTDEPRAGDIDEPHAGDTNEPQAGDACPPACSLGGLAAFARYLPNLEALEISVDTSAVHVDTSAVPVDASAVIVDTSAVIVDASAVTVDTSAFDPSPSPDAYIFSTKFSGTPSSCPAPCPLSSASRLRSLNVGSSQVHAEPTYLAAFLARCFPRLVPEGLVSVSKRWDVVRRLMHEPLPCACAEGGKAREGVKGRGKE